jgi:beta propeller repeat protein
MKANILYLIGTLLISVSADASIRAVETLLTPWGGDKYYPRISGDNVVYDTDVSGSHDVVRVLTNGSGPFVVANSNSIEETPVICGNRVVYVDDSAGNHNLIAFNILSGQQEQFTFSPATDFRADVFDDNAVYVSSRSGSFDIYWYSFLLHLETPIASNQFTEDYPRINGTLVVWQQWSRTNWDIYARYLDGPIITVAATTLDESMPTVSDSLIAFVRGGDIAIYDIHTGITTDITDTPQYEVSPQIDGNWVAWMDDRSGTYDIYLHDLTTGETYQLTDDPGDQWLTDIEGNRVVYWDERAGYANIWMAEWSENQPPVADAGADQEVYEGNFVQLAGLGSDPDGDQITAYLWRMAERPAESASVLSDSTISNPSFIADQGGQYVLTLTVWDDLDASEPDTVVVTAIVPCPMPVPIVEVSTLSGEAPLAVWFDGSQSYDPEGYELTLTWDFGDATPVSHEPALWHTYQYADTFQATLGVTNTCGESSGVYINIQVTSPVTGTAGVLPVALDIEANYPNPFNPSTTISYSVPADGFVELAVYDALGREMRTLVGGRKSAGRHEVVWDGRDGRGRMMASGVYFLRLESSGEVRTRSIVLLK